MPVRNLLQSRLADMRPSEADVVRRLLRNLGMVAEKTLREVAQVCGVSDTTVMRACRAAGYDGFQDLKYHVLRELTAPGRPGPAPRREPGAYAADLEATLAAAASTLPKAGALLSRASRVGVVGVGSSMGIGLVATDILFTLGKQAIPIQTDQMAAYILAPPTSGLLLLAISHCGGTQFPVRVAREARLLGVPTIGVTNEPGSELAESVDILLPTQAVEAARGSYAISPRVCQLAVLDALFAQLSRPDGVPPATRRRKPSIPPTATS